MINMAIISFLDNCSMELHDKLKTKLVTCLFLTSGYVYDDQYLE